MERKEKDNLNVKKVMIRGRRKKEIGLAERFLLVRMSEFETNSDPSSLLTTI
jgi:hypothetical protein